MSEQRPETEELFARVEARWTPEAHHRVRRAIMARAAEASGAPRRRAGVRRWWGPLGAGAALAVAAAALFVGVPQLVGEADPARITLADGSSIVAVSPDARFEVARQSAGEVRVELLRGVVDFDVTPNPERLFRVDAGPLHVEVLGTAFRVERRAGRARVAVTRGRVAARAAEREVVLNAGETVELEGRRLAPRPTALSLPGPAEAGSALRETGRVESEEARGAEPVRGSEARRGEAEAGRARGAPARRVSEGPPGRSAPRRTPTAPERSTASAQKPGAAGRAPSAVSSGVDWRALAQAGRFSEALRALERADPPTSMEDLFLAADTLRLGGRPRQAARVLGRITRRFPEDPRAPLAAFTRGRVLLEALGRPRAAAEAFVALREAHPESSLVEDALAREVEAWSRAGEASRARKSAERYLARFPDGHRRAWVERFGGL